MRERAIQHFILSVLFGLQDLVPIKHVVKNTAYEFMFLRYVGATTIQFSQ